MEKQVVYITAKRDGYALSQVNTITVGELINILERFEDDCPIYLNHDNGFTFGGINKGRIYDDYIETED